MSVYISLMLPSNHPMHSENNDQIVYDPENNPYFTDSTSYETWVVQNGDDHIGILLTEIRVEIQFILRHIKQYPIWNLQVYWLSYTIFVYIRWNYVFLGKSGRLQEHLLLLLLLAHKRQRIVLRDSELLLHQHHPCSDLGLEYSRTILVYPLAMGRVGGDCVLSISDG